MDANDPTAEYVRFHRPAQFDGLELLTAHYFDHSFAPHVHEGYCIALIEQGAERFRCRGTEHCAGVGTLAIVNPDEVHTGRRAGEEGWSYKVFYPDPDLIRRLCVDMGNWQGGTPFFPEAVVDDASLVMPMRQLHQALTGPASQLEREGRWHEAMGLLLRRHARGLAQPLGGYGERAAVSRVQALLRERHADNPGLQELADAVGLSPWHLNRVFRQQVGLPPHAYQTQVRLARAKTLLRGGQSLSDISHALGYADQPHFGRQFKRAFGVTPGQYRQALI
ncbi:helix-turn-helix transcriptional regulator [Chitinimonas sp. JJ19]|uniref:helix-turn-helix transcriptional regulator n=1 Tax=Chitinimonas sp. JJ19 TaxID=3109352 RepID=UPI003001375D